MSTERKAGNPRQSPAARSPQRRGSPSAPTRRWWRSGLLVIALLALLATPALLIPGTESTPKSGPVTLHTVARGDLVVTVTEQGTLESSNNTEIKCRVRGDSTVIWVIESGTEVQPGDELVRLDTLALEDAICERTKYAHLTRSGAERASADVARAKLAIPEYLEGRFRTALMTLEKDLAIAESNLRTAQNLLAHAEKLADRGYVSTLELEEKTISVAQAELYRDGKLTEIEVLKDHTKKIELERLHGELRAAEARLAAEAERAKMDQARLELAEQELEYCVMKAERSGLVIHPSAAAWRNVPEIEEGATVHKDQVLLLMPDLSQMQVKVGIHESIIDRVRPGLAARITLPDKQLDGAVISVAEVTRPAGWWTGNVVKYDTIVELPASKGLKPGMSAEVQLVLDEYMDVLLLPVSAVVSTPKGDFCWVQTVDGFQRRTLDLGDTDDTYLVVQSGLEEAEQVALDPLAAIDEAQAAALAPFDRTTQRGRDGRGD